MVTKSDCIKFLENLYIEYEELEHKAVYTVKEAMAELPGKTEIKNLFISDDKGKKQYLVIMPGLKKLDLKMLANDLGEKKVRFCSPEKVQNILGVKPGSVSLFCCLNPNSKHVKVILDKDIIEMKEVGFHPIVNTSTVYMNPKGAIVMLENLEQIYEVVKL